MRRSSSGDGTLAFGMFELGALVLVAALVVPWYAVTATDGSGYGSVAIRYSFVGVSSTDSEIDGPPAQTVAFEAQGLRSTGVVYNAIEGLIVAAAAFGILAGALVGPIGGRVRSRLVLALAIASVVLAALAPILLAVDQPTTLCSDSQYLPPPLGAGPAPSAVPACPWGYGLRNGEWGVSGPPGPQTSFSGSITDSFHGLVWGPAVGWYLAVLGAVLFSGAGVASQLPSAARRDRSGGAARRTRLPRAPEPNVPSTPGTPRTLRPSRGSG